MTDTNNAGRPAAVEALRLVRELGRRFHAIPRSVSARTDFEIALNAVDAALAQPTEAPAEALRKQLRALGYSDTAINAMGDSTAMMQRAIDMAPAARLAPDGGEVSRLADDEAPIDKRWYIDRSPSSASADDYVGARLRLVCKLAGVPVPDGDDKQIAECAFTLLGTVRAALERANVALSNSVGLTIAQIADPREAASASVRGLATEASPEVAKAAKALVNFLDSSFNLVSLGEGEALLNDLRDAINAPAAQATPAATEAMGEGATDHDSGIAYTLKNPLGVWKSYLREKREHTRCEQELRNCESRIREQRAEINRLAALSRPAAPAEPVALTYCINCDSPMPEGCRGTLKGDGQCALENPAKVTSEPPMSPDGEGPLYDDPYFGVQDEVYLTRAVSVMNDVLTDISGWEDQALAEAVKSSKVDLCAMIECIRMRADSSYVPGSKPIDGEVAAPVSADAQKAVAREPLTEAQPNASPGMAFEESMTITQEFRDNDNPF